MKLQRSMVALANGVAVFSLVTPMLGPWPLPNPGTATQIAQLVASSTSIQKLPSNLLPPLISAGSDSAAAYYSVTAKGCSGPTKCVFGKTSSSKVVFLVGDSHAQMWLPALVPAAKLLGVRLVLEWLPNCPTATLAVWNPIAKSPYGACTTFRSKAIADVKKAAPLFVLITDRTSNVYDANNKLITDAAWQTGEQLTIQALQSSHTKVAVVGDITRFNLTLPDCLGAYPSHVQNCSVANPNPAVHTHFSAEKAAALVTSTVYFDPQSWLCLTICSPIIGNMVAYYDTGHVSATYAEYLSGVWGIELKHLLNP